MELLSHRVTLCLTFWVTDRLLSKAAVLYYILTSSMSVSISPHSLQCFFLYIFSIIAHFQNTVFSCGVVRVLYIYSRYKSLISYMTCKFLLPFCVSVHIFDGVICCTKVPSFDELQWVNVFFISYDFNVVSKKSLLNLYWTSALNMFS